MLTIRRLLWLYPKAHRWEFQEEMAEVLSRLEDDSSKTGLLTRLRFYVRESAGLMAGALLENWHQAVMRRFTMGNNFRFPKTTWILMILILAGVISAIRKGEAISVSLPSDNPAIGPIHPANTVMAGWVMSFFIMYAVGLVVGGVFFLVRRRKLAQTSAD
jgi:hypothetical protein